MEDRAETEEPEVKRVEARDAEEAPVVPEAMEDRQETVEIVVPCQSTTFARTRPGRSKYPE